ncbi:hypothetical protein C8Q79DRAFT_526858 [Trametes meyenii]|nr:hypothetical protein C8Q79DRAFT_526858 [Trametes meyenii]
MVRMEADEKGKRSAGLSAWQCRRCTKRPRIEPPTTTLPTSVLSVQSTQPAVPSVIIIDDDIQEVVPSPKQGVVDVPTQTPLTGPSPQYQATREVAAEGTTIGKPTGLEPLLPKPVPRLGNFQEVRFISSSGQAGQSRLRKKTLVVTPVQLPSKQTSKKTCIPPQAHVSLPSSTVPRTTTTQSSYRSPSYITPTIPPTSISTRDVREPVSTARAQAQLEPPPVVDYVLHRPRNPPQPPDRAPSATDERAHTDTRSRTRDLIDVEMKLDDFAMQDDSPGPESEPESRPLEPSPDPHNIDDLYGDVAPAYRGGPPPALRARSIAPTRSHLLFDVQKRRMEAQQAPMAAVRHNCDADDARKPRKGIPRLLKGRALAKKQAAGLNFDVSEVDWGT